MDKNHVLALGPYVGDFEQEILTFIPYMRWISEVRNANVYISTHFNRSFFYNWVPKENIFPVYEEFSRNELQQSKYIHETISLSDYMLILKQFKNFVQDRHKDLTIDNYYLNYSKGGKVHYPIYKKIFEKIESKDCNKKDYIVFIPDNRYCADELQQIYDIISNKYKIFVVGDMKTHLVDENVILQYPDYVENGYKYIMSYINSARAVICPASHWSVLVNIQQIPLFTWGLNVSQFKDGGIYNFQNKCFALSADRDTEVTRIVDSFYYFMEHMVLPTGW